jgi:hypothetical protein
MRRLAKAAVFLSLVALFISFLPRWAAQREEKNRESLFKAESSQYIAQGLPACPPRGPELDAYLEGAQKKMKGAALWRPLCRVPELPVGKITVVIEHRNDFESCANQWTPSNLHCALSEPITYLADSEQRRTWARREVHDKLNQDIIWISSRPMAWQDWLFVEYQNRIQLGIVSFLGLSLSFALFLRLRFSIQQQRLLRQNGLPMPPRMAELLLLFLATGRPSMVGDTGEEYCQMIDSGHPKAEADRWYRVQALYSVLPLAWQSGKNLVRDGF